jgi:archaellum biogenesis ATPase FlaH
VNSANELFQQWFSMQKNLKEIEFGERETDLIEGVLPAGNIVFVTGQPKDGKSLLVQGWAHSVATGTPWNGHRSEQGAVLYLYPDGEHPKYLAERISALEKHTGAPVDYENAFRFDDSFSLSNEGQVNNILAGVEYAGLKLLIIDTIAAATPGMDLNNAKEVSQIASFAKEITKKSNGKTTVVIVAHSPKSYSKGISGSTQLQAMASLTYSMEKSGTAKSGFTYRLRVVESRHSAGRYEADFITDEIEIEEGLSSVVLISKNSHKSGDSRYANALATTFSDLPRGEWIPQVALVKEVMSRLSISDSHARRWVTGAIEDMVIQSEWDGKRKGICIPNPQQSPSSPHGETTSVPHLSHSLKSGEWGKEGEINNENQ